MARFTRKRFSGAEFTKTKREAEREADRIRDKGRRAKVVKATPTAMKRGANFMVFTGQKLK